MRVYARHARTYLEPGVHDVLHGDELLLPLSHLVLEGFDEGRAAHRLRLDDVVVEEHLDVVDRRQDVHALQTQQTHATSQTQRHKHVARHMNVSKKATLDYCRVLATHLFITELIQ